MFEKTFYKKEIENSAENFNKKERENSEKKITMKQS